MENFGTNKKDELSEALALDRAAISKMYIKGNGIEIGALNGPLPVSEQASVKYVDRMSVEDLKKHYEGLELVNVDIVDDGEKLEKFQDSVLDFVIANHFLEHCQNPILAIINMMRVLREGGVLYMSVPDKRYTFDIDRPITSVEHVIKDYFEGPAWSRRQHFEEWTKYVSKKGTAETKQFANWLMNIDYSIHYHVWTQQEIMEFLLTLREKIGLNFEIELFLTLGIECIFILKKGSADSEHQFVSAAEVNPRQSLEAKMVEVTPENLGIKSEKKAEAGKLVSIIVRTKDRPKLLKTALSSISTQTYRPLEVVLVNDGGCDLNIEEIKNILGDVSLKYIRIEKNSGRARAGNIGIENAAGEYVGFLDDDDELRPNHILRLVSFLEQNDYQVAYSDTVMLSKEFSPEQSRNTVVENRVFSKDFSYPDLLVGNYIPFNSVLFSKAVLTSSGGIDESLELYEDWDFLIRIGQKHLFFHIKGVTAVYNQWSKDLQINKVDSEYMRKTRLKVIEKHRDKITSPFILDIWEKCESIDSALSQKDAALKEKDAALAKIDAILAEAAVEKECLSKENSIVSSEREAACKERDALQLKLSETSKALSEKNGRVVQLENEIRLMWDTLGWQFLERLRRVREKLFRRGSKRREFYELFVRSIKYLKKNGAKQFIRKATGRNKQSSDSFDEPYALWISKNEPGQDRLKEQIRLSGEFKLRPKISIITPVYNPERKALIEMIESVLAQTYDRWELCLADASTNPDVRKTVDNYVKVAGGKIKVKYLEENRGIAGNSNEALSLATGEYIALLDHDDTLAPFALFEIVKSINESPETDFIYSDRDMISGEGKRFNPFFKPGWSPDYLLSQNYVCHLNVLKAGLMDKAGAFRPGYDGSQDYDLVLRATELAVKIKHIPKILYHWRIVSGSASGDPEAKPYAYDAAVRALQDAADRRGWKGIATQGKVKGLYRIKFAIAGNPKVSIIIPTKDKTDVLKKCLTSIFQKTTYKNYEVVLVDNGSVEKRTFVFYKELKDNPHIKMLEYEAPFNFSEINNYGVSNVEADYVLFLNNDVEIITPDWLEVMLGFAQRNETGAVGIKLLYPDNRIQTAGLILDEEGNVRRSHYRYPAQSLGYAGRIQAIQNVSALAAACMMMRKEVFEEVGGFDPQYVIAHGDIDLCLKILHKKYLIVYEPHAEIYHYESLTRGYEDTPEKVERLRQETELLMKNWRHVLKKGDPYFSPNLSAEKEDFAIRV